MTDVVCLADINNDVEAERTVFDICVDIALHEPEYYGKVASDAYIDCRR